MLVADILPGLLVLIPTLGIRRLFVGICLIVRHTEGSTVKSRLDGG
jgi:hypothetical protein